MWLPFKILSENQTWLHFVDIFISILCVVLRFKSGYFVRNKSTEKKKIWNILFLPMLQNFFVDLQVLEIS